MSAPRPVREYMISNSSGPALQPRRLPAQIDWLVGKLFFLIPIGIIGNIIFVFACTDRTIFQSLTHFSPVYLIIAAVLSVIPWFTGSLRLFLWSGFIGRTIRYQDLFKIYLGAELGAAVSPPMIGGSAVKIGMLMQHGFSGSEGLSLTLLESLEDSVFFIVVVPIALTVSSSWNLPIVKSCLEEMGHPSFWMVFGSICAVLCSIAVSVRLFGRLAQWFPLVHTIAEKIKFSYALFKAIYRTIIRSGKGILALTMLLTAIQWFCRYSIVTVLLMSLGIPAQPVLFMALQVIIFALMAFVPTPGGAGGAEVMFSLLYGSLLPSGTTGVVTTGWRFLTFYFLLLLAAPLVLLFGLKQGAATMRKNS